MSIQVKKILVPIDFSEYSKSALKYATSFAEIFHSELVLVYVIEPVIYPPDFSMGQISIPAVDLEMDKRAKEELEKLAQTEFNSSIKVTTMVKTGKPFVEIIETAKEEEVDLIIISSHGHSGVEQILFGSTAEKVVRKSTCPVLTIRRESKVSNS
jgi:nucleotide-binding universal stress UspA family protein